MALILRQSTSVVISFGAFVDKTDGVTPETGLVSAIDHATTGILLSKNGGALTIRSQAVTASTYDAYGMYRVTLSTTDTNTVGTLRMAFIETATCLPVWQDFQVVEEEVYDDLYKASAVGYLKPTTPGNDLDVSSGGEAGVDWANVGTPGSTVGLSATTVKTATDVETDTQNIQGRLPTALVSGRMDSDVAAIQADAITAAAIAADAIGASELAADAATEIADALLTRQMTEAYAAVGVQPTVAQALYAILQTLSEFGITSTVISVKGINGVTEKMTFTLNDNLNPTSRVRAT